MKANHWHSMKMKTPCTPHRWDLFSNVMRPVLYSETHSSLHMHGRLLESRRPPLERWRRSTHSATPALPPAPHPHILLPVHSIFISFRRHNLTSHCALTCTFNSVSWSHTPVRCGNREYAGDSRPCPTRAFEAAYGPTKWPRGCV